MGKKDQKSKDKPYKEIELYNGEVLIHFHPKSKYYYLVRDGEDLPKKKRLSGATGYTSLIKTKKALQGLTNWALDVMESRAIELLGDGKTFTLQDIRSVLAAAKSAPEDEKLRAAGIGDYVHAFAERYMQSLDPVAAYDEMIEDLGMPNDEDKAKIDVGAKGLIEWIEKNNAKILDGEQVLYSRKFGHAGRFDAIMEIKGKKYMVDYKTSNGIYDEHYFQVASYLKAYEEGGGEKLDGALIIGIVKQDKEKNGIVIRHAGDIIPKFVPRSDVLQDYIAFKSLIPIKKRLNERDAMWRKENVK